MSAVQDREDDSIDLAALPEDGIGLQITQATLAAHAALDPRWRLGSAPRALPVRLEAPARPSPKRRGRRSGRATA
jgi:hypothetical protein